MSDPTVQQIFANMPTAFLPARANGLSAVVQFLISGEGGGDWVVTIANQQCQVVPGQTAKPQLTIAAPADLLPDLLMGRQNGMMAFMQGKLRIQGDLTLAQKLISLFAMPS
jgi:putative sterol carrier protein